VNIMKKLIAASVLVLSCTACDKMAASNGNAPAAADNASVSADSALTDLKGHWIGTSESIVRGSPMHHAAQSGDTPLLDNVQFDYNFVGQDGRRFWGTVTGKGTAEPIMGVIAYDGKTIVAQDSDGMLQGKIVDADTIEAVYSHTNAKSTVVAANRIKRQK
jgi:hypothetical protein